MKKNLLILLTLSSLFLSSCSSNTADKMYFKLANNYWPTQNSSTITMNERDKLIYIDFVDVAHFLNKNGIVLQTGPITYNTATNNVWISPIHQQLSELMIRDFSVLLPNYFISNDAMTKPYATIKLFIDGFHGSYTGHAIVKGRWIVNIDHKIYIKTFEQKTPLTNDGYDALVKALSTSWLNEEIDFIKQIQF